MLDKVWQLIIGGRGGEGGSGRGGGIRAGRGVRGGGL